MLKKFIGTKQFYFKLLTLTLPIMVQSGITNFVNMLDNIMIGAVGTPQMTGVAICNQLIFVFNLCVFGTVSGAGIFGAQYFGKQDYKGVHYTFRFKLIFCMIVSLLGITLFAFKGENLLLLYMKGDAGLTDAFLTLSFAKDYLKIMLIGLIPYAIVQCYSSTLRESGNPNLPMIAGIVAVFVNLSLNYILIFGKFGAPTLGVRGAAIATVISRFAELFVVVFIAHVRVEKYRFLKGAYKSLYIPSRLFGQFFIKGLPLVLNETLWALSMATINQCYSSRGLDAVAANNISQTFWNVFAIVYLSVGSSVAIIVGQLLGANKLKEAREESTRLIFTSFCLATLVSVGYFFFAKVIPNVYNTETEIKTLATTLMQITAIAMPFDALALASYYTIRSGGKMLITFMFDSGFSWCVNVVVAFVLSRYTALSFITIFLVVNLTSILKGAIGILFVKNGFWVRNLT